MREREGIRERKRREKERVRGEFKGEIMETVIASLGERQGSLGRQSSAWKAKQNSDC